jgi:methylmalonyl-CoA mutase N-terminal domain/subunit
MHQETSDILRPHSSLERQGPATTADIAAAQQSWKDETYKPDSPGDSPRKSVILDCGVPVDPLYTPANLASSGFDYLRDLGFPGQFPFTRGDSATMNRHVPFVVSAYSGFGDAEICNQRFRKLLDWGAEQILVAFDLPTQCGYDSDHEMSAGEVGQVGVAIDSLADVERLFEGIPVNSLKRVGTLGNSIGPIVLALFAALGEKQGIPWSQYNVNLQNDPLKEYIARGTQIFPPEPAARLACDTVEWCVENAPHWSPMTVCVNHINAGGAGSSVATGIALANAKYYIDELLSRGLRIDSVAPLLHMFPDERHDFFASIANLRALRRIWARLMRESYGALSNDSLALRTTVYGHGQETLQEPLNNIARSAFGALAYVLGGASYVYIASYDEGVSTPSEQSVLVGLRTLQIIAHEHGFTDTIDALGGSYFIETLTNQIEQQILNTLKMIETQGGALRVIDGGIGRRLMTEGAVRRQKAIESGQRSWVTINKWPQKPNVPNSAFRIDPETANRQIRNVQSVRASRDTAKVKAALSAVAEATRSNKNVVPSVLEAVRAYATVGEIVDVWRGIFGNFAPSTAF